MPEGGLTDFVVIGAGPAGLLAATGLAKRGFPVQVYEGRPSLDQRPEESYPIGLNLRGLRAVERVAGKPYADRLLKEGYVVDEWAIMAGGRKVAKVSSGHCYSHTRFAVTKACFDAATVGTQEDDSSNSSNASTNNDYTQKVHVFFNKHLSEYNAHQHSLTFSDGTFMKLSPTTGLIAGDGVWSNIRKALTKATPLHALDRKITETVIPWGMGFRVMFFDKAIPAGFDPKIHYIWNGVYAAVTGSNSQWSVVPSCREGDKEVESWFDATEATPENLAGLRKYLQERVPPCKNKVDEFFSPEEQKAFFTRRVFRGGISHASWSTFGGNVVLLGDALHGLYPASGEGVNSALDDVACLMDCLDVWSGVVVKPIYKVIQPEGARTFFDSFAPTRQPAVDALHALVKDILLMQNGTGQERAVQIMGSIFSKFSGKPTEAEYRYGPASSKELLPYEEIVARHAEQVAGPRKWAARLVSPFKSIKTSRFNQGSVNLSSVAKSVRSQ
jgi:kynurenine 3-monooxygenase